MEDPFPGKPAPWLHHHPSEQRLRSYYGPVRRRAPRPVLSAFGFRRWQAPSRDHHDLGRGFDARLLTFRARAADQAHAASTPDTAWPVNEYPPGSSRRACYDLRFRCRLQIFDASTAHAQPETGGRFLERLPGPHLTGSSPAFSLNAHHDSLQLTQLQGGLTPTPAGPTPEGQQASISRTAPPMSGSSYTTPPSAFVTHW